MANTIKPFGPSGVKRPFHPVIGEEDPAKRIARALEHIAVALSAIDHNVEILADRLIQKF
jgi:hypothetical protein